MKAAKWRDLSEDELTQKARDLSEEVFNLRFQLAMGVAKNPSRLSQARRDLARANTVLVMPANSTNHLMYIVSQYVKKLLMLIRVGAQNRCRPH